MSAGLDAQQNIIESLQTRRAGEGVVTIHQDADYLFDREALCAFYQFGAGKTLKSSWISRTGVRWNNSRQARSEANRVATKVKQISELPVYTCFSLPAGYAVGRL